MSAPALLVIDGYQYMSTKSAAKLWGLTPKTVSNYCKDGKIKNKFKNGKLGWYIRTDEIKPLSRDDIRKILILTLQLKNNPSYGIDWTLLDLDNSALERVYQHLCSRGYVEPILIADKHRIPYDAVLTPKGMELVTTTHHIKPQDLYSTVTQWLPIIISAAQLFLQIQPAN